MIEKRDYYYIVQQGDTLERILNKHSITKLNGEMFKDYEHEEEAWFFINRYKDKNKELLEDAQIFKDNPHTEYGVVNLNEWDSMINEGDESLEKGAEKILDWCKNDLNPPEELDVDDYWDNLYKRYYSEPWPRQGNLILYIGEKVWIPADSEYKRREITSNELENGYLAVSSKKEELVFPGLTVNVKINPDEDDIDEDKYTLYSIDPNNSFKKTIKVSEEKIVSGPYVSLRFVGTPQKMKYNLELESSSDESNSKPDKQIVLKDFFYNKDIE